MPAFTLVEVLLATVMVALMAAGVAAILQVAAYGSSSQREVRRVVVRSRQAQARLDAALRNAHAILASGSGYIVLWTGDSRTDKKVNPSELQLIELASGTLTSYTTVYPGGWTQAQIDAADTAYPTGTNYYTAAQNAKSGAYFPGTPWCTQLSGLSFTLNAAVATEATLVTYSVTLTDASLTEPVQASVALRVQEAPG